MSSILLAATGWIYAAMHYLMTPVDPFSVVNHPLEPTMLKAHLVFAPALVFLVGVIFHSHILLKKENGVQSGRWSGVLMAWLFGVMVMSGYLLQVLNETGRQAMLWIHLVSGSIWVMGYAAHQFASIRVKRRMRLQREHAILAIAAAALLMATAGRLAAHDVDIEPLEREAYLMGTQLHLALYEKDAQSALVHSEAILHAVEETESQLSTWKTDSELSGLNRQPVLQQFQMSPSLCDLMLRTNRWVTATEGAFDPGLGQLAAAWDIHGAFRIPDGKEIQQALAVTGMGKIRFDDISCTAVRTTHILIDPGAFGKGEALDRAARIALQIGAGPLLLDFGGQILVTAPEPGGQSWTIPLANPQERMAGSSVRVHLRTGSLSTSGGSERNGLVNGIQISHILDPRSGQPVESFGSVTVWSSSAFDADVLSTALYVMGPRKGLRWARLHGIAACFLIVDKGSVRAEMSPRFEWVIK